MATEATPQTSEATTPDTAPTVDSGAPAPGGKRHALRRIVKEGSAFSLLKVAATALTAVSMALISSRLTGFVNSLILVGLVSVGTALVSEAYRIVLSITSLGARKMIAPILPTPTGGPVTGDGPSPGDPTPTPTPGPPVAPSASTGDRPHGVRARVGSYFRHNPVMKFALLFTAISALTIGGSYLVSSGNVSTESNYTTVHTTTQQSLSEKEKQALINAAATKATADASAQEDSSNAALLKRIGDLEEQNRKLQAQVDALPTSGTDSATTASIKALQEQMTTLQAALEELRAQVNSGQQSTTGNGTTTPTPTPTPTTTPSGGGEGGTGAQGTPQTPGGASGAGAA